MKEVITDIIESKEELTEILAEVIRMTRVNVLNTKEGIREADRDMIESAFRDALKIYFD